MNSFGTLRVKEITSDVFNYKLETKINDWLRENHVIVKDIKYIMSTTNIHVLIIYQLNEPE